MRLCQILAVLALFAASTLPTRADTITRFVLSGITSGGSPISGVVEISTITGSVWTVNMFVGDLQFGRDLSVGSYFDGTSWITEFNVTEDTPDYANPENITIALEIPSFVGFEGGDLCCDTPIYQHDYIIDTVEDGTLEPAVPIASTPEPSTFSLFGTGLIILGTMRRKFFC